MLAFYGIEMRIEETREWYDGYHFGDADIYCPWDVINFVYDAKDNPKARPEAFWINTSSNGLVKRFISMADNINQGLIIEVKCADRISEIDKACERAMAQIKDRRYDESLRNDGRNDILAYGIAFYKKRCKVIAEKYT